MRALPPLGRPGQAPRTGVGELLGGPAKPQDDFQELLPWQRNPETEGGQQQAPKLSETRDLLESNIVIGPPRPWGASDKVTHFQKGDVPGLRASVGLPAPFALPTEALREQEVATARLAARLAACERRMDTQEAKAAVEETEAFQRLSVECRQVKESMLTNVKLADERLSSLENGLERTKREEMSLKEQTNVLSNDFREFVGTAVARQRAEIESVVTRAFSQQNAAAEEWRNAMRQRDSQLQSEVQRVNHMTEDVGHQLVSTQAELRARLAALETSRMAGRANGGSSIDGAVMSDVAGSHMTDFLKQQVDALRQHVEQSAARIAELTARCDGDNAAQRALKKENDTRIAALGKAIASERDNLAQRMLQRVEVLESRLGVERSEVNAKQAEIRDQVASGDHQGSLQLQDVASQIRKEFEALERRVHSEISSLNGQVEAEFAQIRSSRTSDEDVHRQSQASIIHRLESANEKQSELLNSLRREVDLSFKEIRDSISKESVVRAEEDRKLATEASKASLTITNDLQAVQRYIQRQAEMVASELERIRWTNTDARDKLSRYVDEKVARGNLGPAVSKFDTEADALVERISTLKASLEEQGRVAEQRIESFAEDFRVRLKKVEEAWMRESAAVRRDAERTATAAERRTITAQGELKARFESYVKHFDTTITSLQTAILRPIPGDGADIAVRALPLSPSPPISARTQAGTTPRRSTAFKPSQQPEPKPLDAPRDLALWQQEELRCIVDGLRIHSEPDLASQVVGSLSRGESVVVKNVIAPTDGRRWACLMKGGFVLAFSEGGTPLLQLPQAAPTEMQIAEDVPTIDSISDEEYMRLMAEQERLHREIAAEEIALYLEQERQRREAAAAKIQAVRRGREVRQVVRPELERRDIAIKRLQAAERGRQVRKELRPLRLIRDEDSVAADLRSRQASPTPSEHSVRPPSNEEQFVTVTDDFGEPLVFKALSRPPTPPNISNIEEQDSFVVETLTVPSNISIEQGSLAPDDAADGEDEEDSPRRQEKVEGLAVDVAENITSITGMLGSANSIESIEEPLQATLPPPQ